MSTVTSLLDGHVLRRDSRDSEQVIRPGELNLMTAGRGLSHAEEPTRRGEPAFERHGALPRVPLPQL